MSKNNFILIALVAALAVGSILGNKSKSEDAPAKAPAQQATRIVCSEDQKAASRATMANIETLAFREEVLSSSAWYQWRSGWFSLGFDGQRDITRAIADTEYCLSDGQIVAVFIEFNGERVAECENGVVRILRSRPQ